MNENIETKRNKILNFGDKLVDKYKHLSPTVDVNKDCSYILIEFKNNIEEFQQKIFINEFEKTYQEIFNSNLNKPFMKQISLENGDNCFTKGDYMYMYELKD